MKPRGSYFVLTGERGSGKTVICTNLVAEARGRGLDVAGILSAASGPELHSPRQVIDLRSGLSRLLGTPTRSGQDPLTPNWELDPRVFAWVAEVLRAATPCDLLIVDEVGPLELLGGRGWVSALEVLRVGRFGGALVVCRPSLLDKLETSLGRPPAATFKADPKDDDDLPDLILETIFD